MRYQAVLWYSQSVNTRNRTWNLVVDYPKIYEQIIERGRNRVPNGYVERHHIIPECMGGPDTKENLVALYPEEHFVAHALLLKIHKETNYRYALAKAVQQMCVGHEGKRVRRKLYGWLKREHALAMSVSQSGSGNSQFGSRWVCNLETKENKKISKEQEIPEGWIAGRTKTWRSPAPKEKIEYFCSCGKRLSGKVESGLCRNCFWSGDLGSANAKKRVQTLKEKDPIAFSEKQRSNIKKRCAGVSERSKETAFQADE